MGFDEWRKTLTGRGAGLKKAAENMTPLKADFGTRVPYIAQSFVDRDPKETRMEEEAGVLIATSRIESKQHANQDESAILRLDNGIAIALLDGATYGEGKVLSNSEEFVQSYKTYLKMIMEKNEKGYRERLSQIAELFSHGLASDFLTGSEDLEELLKDIQESFLDWSLKYNNEFKHADNWVGMGSLSFTIPVRKGETTTLVCIQVGNMNDSGDVSVLLPNNEVYQVSPLFAQENAKPQGPGEVMPYGDGPYKTFLYYYGQDPNSKSNMSHSIRPGASISSARISVVYDLPKDAVALVSTDGVKNGAVKDDDDATFAYIPLNL